MRPIISPPGHGRPEPRPARVGESALTFSDDPPRAEEGAVQAQVREALVLLEALVESPEDWRDGGVAEPEGGGGEDVGGRRVRRAVVSPVGTDVTFKGLGAEDFRDVISHGDDLQDRGERGGEPNRDDEETDRIIFSGGDSAGSLDKNITWRGGKEEDAIIVQLQQ